MRSIRKAVGAAALAFCVIAVLFVPGSASATSTTHAVRASSETNFSTAFERPATWSLSCDTATKVWAFRSTTCRSSTRTVTLGRSYERSERPLAHHRVGFTH